MDIRRQRAILEQRRVLLAGHIASAQARGETVGPAFERELQKAESELRALGEQQEQPRG